MAINLKLRVLNLTSAKKYYYQQVDSDQGDSGSDYIFVGSADLSGSAVSSEFSSDLLNSYSSYSLFHNASPVTLNSATIFSDFDGYEQGIYGPNSGGNTPAPVSSSVQQTYFLNITHPETHASASNWQGTWTHYDSGDNLLDVSGPSTDDFTVTFPGSTNSEIKMVFGEKVGDSSGNEWTTSTIPTLTWTSSNSSVKNIGIDSVTYSTTTSTDDTVTIGVSYDGNVEDGDTVSFTLSYGSVYDQYGNQASSPSYSNFSSGDLTWPATGGSGRSYFNRTFNVYNDDSSTAHFYIQVDEGEGEDGSSWKYIDGVAAGATGSVVLSSIFHNDDNYGGYGSSKYLAAAASSASISGQYWNPSSEFGYGSYAQVQFDGSYGFALSDEMRRLDITYNGGYDSSGGSFSSWSAFDVSDNEIDTTTSTPTVTLVNSSGTGTVTIDYEERMWASDSYSPSSFSDLRDVVMSDFSQITAYRIDGSNNYGSSPLTGSLSVASASFSYQTSDDSGALAVYGTDNTGNYSGATGWWYPVYLDVADAGGAGSSHEHTFSEYSGVTFHMPDGTMNHGSSTKPSGYTIYEDQLQITFTYSGTPTADDWLSISGLSNGLFDPRLNKANFSVGDGSTATPKFQDESSSTDEASESIGSSGGSVSISGASLTVPASALSSDQTIGLNKTADADAAHQGIMAAAGNPDMSQYSPVITATPHGQNFDQAVTIQFDLTGTAAGSCPANLKIYKRAAASGPWYELPQEFWSCSGGTVTISTTSFSQYQAVGGSNMAITKLNNRQLEKFKSVNKALAKAVDLSGSANLSGDVLTGDEMLIQRSGQAAKAVTVDALQNFFSSVDVEAVDGNSEDYQLVFTHSTGSGKLATDVDGVKWNPQSDTLTATKLGAFEAAGAINFASQAMTSVNIDSGDISGTDVDVSGQTLTLDNDQISGDKVEGGTIAEITITDLTLGDVSGSGAAQFEGPLTVNGNILPSSDDVSDLGSSSKQFRNLHLDGTANIDALVALTADIDGGTIDGVTIATSDVDVSGQTLTLDAGQVGADKVGAGTFDAGTYSFAGSTISALPQLTASHARITNLDVVTLNSVVQTEETLEIADKVIIAAAGANDAGADGAAIQFGGSAASDDVASIAYSDSLNSGAGGFDLSLDSSVFVSLHDAGIIPDADDEMALGSGTKRYSEAHIAEAHIDQLGQALDANSVIISNANIDSGTIDGVTIATSDITVGATKELDVSAGTLTLAADQISGDKVEGGTIDAITITALQGATVSGSSTAQFGGNVTSAGDFLPSSDNASDLGAAAKRYAQAHVVEAHIDQLGQALDANSQIITDINIDSGNIDGVTVATSDVDMTGQTLTLDDDAISGDKVEGGTIDGITITALSAGTVSGSGAATFASSLTVQGDIFPLDNYAAVNLGASGRQFNDLYINGVAHLDAVDASDFASATADIDVTGDGIDDFIVFKDATDDQLKVQSLNAFLQSLKGDGLQIGNDGLITVDPVVSTFSGSLALQNTHGAYVSASLAEEPVVDSLQVYLNGMLQTKYAASGLGASTWDYKLEDGSGTNQMVVFGIEPEEDDAIVIHYVKK